MQVTVKETKVLKTGTGQYGEWKLVKIATEDTEYTTLAKEAETIAPGAIINITDMDKDEKGRESFKKFEVIEQASNRPASPALPTPSDMSKDDWAEKQRIERECIEAQTAVKAILSMDLGTTDQKAQAKIQIVYQKALDWCEAKIDANMNQQGRQHSEPSVSTPETKEALAEGVPEFKTGVELFNYGLAHGKTASEMKENLSINNPNEIEDVAKATAILFPKE